MKMEETIKVMEEKLKCFQRQQELLMPVINDLSNLIKLCKESDESEESEAISFSDSGINP